MQAITLLAGPGAGIAFEDFNLDIGATQHLSKAKPAEAGTDDNNFQLRHGTLLFRHRKRTYRMCPLTMSEPLYERKAPPGLPTGP